MAISCDKQYWVLFVVVDLCMTAGVRKLATELGKVKEMYGRVYVLVEKDNKRTDPSKYAHLNVNSTVMYEVRITLRVCVCSYQNTK